MAGAAVVEVDEVVMSCCDEEEVDVEEEEVEDGFLTSDFCSDL